jgi:hypothetical protein
MMLSSIYVIMVSTRGTSLPATLSTEYEFREHLRLDIFQRMQVSSDIIRDVSMSVEDFDGGVEMLHFVTAGASKKKDTTCVCDSMSMLLQTHS